MSIPVKDIIADAVLDPDSHEPVSPDVAAQRVVELFQQTRTSVTPGGTQEPLGVEVDVNVELSGLAGQPVWLRWSIYPAAGGPHLFGAWLGSFVANQLTPSTDDDTGSVSLWLPMPVEPGPYLAKLELFAKGQTLASATTPTFG